MANYAHRHPHPPPCLLPQAYNQSAATLNLLRGFSTGGYGGLNRVGKWNLDFMGNSTEVRSAGDAMRRERREGAGLGVVLMA